MTNNHFEGQEVPPDAVDWIRANPHDARRVLEGIEWANDPHTPELHSPPVLEWAHEGEAKFPKPILGCAKMGGAILSEGEICVLSAAGGIGKSTLAASIALSVAAAADDLHEPMELEGGLFHGFGGTVIYATYEDPPSVIKSRLRRLAKQWDQRFQDGHSFTDALCRVGIVSMRGWPLYGPIGDRASYNSVPGRMPGWHHLWDLVRHSQPILLIIDPALTAFVGEANSPTQVMAFLDTLSSQAGKRKAGMLLLAHSTKSSRSERTDPFHPGMVSGTGAWTDHVRGVLTMGEHKRDSQDHEKEAMLVLRVYKANWGPQRITVRLQPVTDDGDDAPMGFVADGPWSYGSDPGAHQSHYQTHRSENNIATPMSKGDFNDFA